MNVNTQAMESLFGPPSEPANIAEFLQVTHQVEQNYDDINATTGPPFTSRGWEQFSDDEKSLVASQCSVADIRDSLYDVWNDPTLSARILKDHELTVAALHTSASTSTRSTKSAKRTHLPDPDKVPQEIAALQKNLDSVKLKSWRLTSDAAFFLRTSKNSDHNVLGQVKYSQGSTTTEDMHQAVITVSVYNRVPWSPSYVSHASQHVILSSQTLEDLYNVIPCTSKELPQIYGSGNFGDMPQGGSGDDCVICIEDVAHGSRSGDYARKLLQHLEKVSKVTTQMKEGTFLADTAISSLTLRVNEPYWMLHYGNCEHFIVVEQVRLRCKSDPLGGYPLTIQITPPLLDLCRACAKVPAVYSIVGDIRLGETPCPMCGPCWSVMGDSDDENVKVVPLPNYGMNY